MYSSFPSGIVGIIAGSGLRSIPELQDAEERAVDTPYGKPSAPLLMGEIGGVPVAFLRRHGAGHTILPTDINVRANVYALKAVGVGRVVSLSAVGSLTERAPPGTFVAIDQFIDRTSRRIKTFFETGLVGHVPFGSPVCRHVSGALQATLEERGHAHLPAGTYVVMEGPQFSTRAEVGLYRSWDAHVVGMTATPEAKLCREAEMCYALIGMVTDFDCWHVGHEDVTAAAVERVMQSNAHVAADLLRYGLSKVAAPKGDCPHGCSTALDGAIMTPLPYRDPALVERLRPILARVLGEEALRPVEG